MTASTIDSRYSTLQVDKGIPHEQSSSLSIQSAEYRINGLDYRMAEAAQFLVDDASMLSPHTAEGYT